MSDTFRYRYGNTNPVMMAVDSATVIEVGDLLYLNTDDAKNAGDQTDQLSETLNQRLFASKFLGVALQRSRSGDDDPIEVATSGVFEFVCPSSTYEVGGLLGADETAAGTALEDQVVVAVTSEDLAIGKVAKTVSSAATNVYIDIQSKVMSKAALGSTPLFIPAATPQSLSGAGACDVLSFLTKWTTTGAQAGTLADGLIKGQLKKIQLIVDGGDGTLTPANLAGGTTITFADAGDFALLLWDGTDWNAIDLGNDADGATAPVLA